MPKMERHSQVLTISGGRRVGLAEYGVSNGLPVVALHGTPASRFMFDVADEAACRLGVTLYCPERPGYGLSDPPDRPFAANTLARRTDELVGIVDALGLDQFSIMGVSGGAPYAVSVACRLSRRVRSLGLVSPVGPIAGLPESASSQISRGHRFLFGTLARWPNVVRVGGSIGAGVFSFAPVACSKFFAWGMGAGDQKILSKAFAQTSLISMTNESVRNGVSGAVADLAVFSKPWSVDFKALSAPTVLWSGTEDRLVPVASSLWLGSQLPGCEVIKLEGAGHFWVYQEIERVLARVARMVES